MTTTSNSMPAIGTRVEYRTAATKWRDERVCTGTVTWHYPGHEEIDDETGEKYVTADAVSVKVDAPLPKWWPYVGSDQFCPDVSDVTPIVGRDYK